MTLISLFNAQSDKVTPPRWDPFLSWSRDRLLFVLLLLLSALASANTEKHRVASQDRGEIYPTVSGIWAKIWRRNVNVNIG